MKKTSIAFLGAGNAGTTLANVAAKNGHDVRLWTIEKDVIAQMKKYRINKKYLPGVKLLRNVKVCEDLQTAVKDADLITMCIPSSVMRNMCMRIKPFVKRRQVIVNIAKGIEDSTLMLMSQVITDVLGDKNAIVTISGPMIASELAHGMPTAVAVAGTHDAGVDLVHRTFTNDFFKMYKNIDLVGVELGGSLKNIIAIAAGISDGLGYGSNTKSALITRGLAEITHLGVCMGGKPLTFSGLSGLGDLYTTCTSPYSRNRRLGELIGKGKSLETAQKQVAQVAEGLFAVKVGYLLGKRYQIDLPITNILYRILYEGKRNLRLEMSGFMRGFNEIHL